MLNTIKLEVWRIGIKVHGKSSFYLPEGEAALVSHEE